MKVCTLNHHKHCSEQQEKQQQQKKSILSLNLLFFDLSLFIVRIVVNRKMISIHHA